MGSGCTDARIVARGEELEFGVARGERWSIRNGDEEGSEHGFFRVECHSVFGIMVVRSALGCVRVGRLHAVDPRPSHLQLLQHGHEPKDMCAPRRSVAGPLFQYGHYGMRWPHIHIRSL